MNVTVRREVVCCRKCKHKVEFWYISDFSYGERLVLYNEGKKYAYINLLKDEIYDQVVKEIETILKAYKKDVTKEKKQEIVNMVFMIACDKINGSEVDFKGNRKCENCESEEFEDLLVEPEQIVNVEIPEITHNNWNTLSEDERKQAIINFFKYNIMDENFQIVLKEYIEKIDDICNLLIKEINLSENLKLKNKYDFFEYRAKCRKMEFEFSGVSYRLHGKGCIAYTDKMFFDWDFGYRSRWCGIDPWKVAMTLKKSNSPYIDYYDGNLIKTLCEEMVHNGILYKKYEQYYFEIKLEDTFEPDFPTNYDTLIIEYNDLKWIISRNKLVDQFIRKSVRIQNKIYSDADKYTLKFCLAENIVYSIPYNELRFPEGAVEVMSDEIIKKLYKREVQGI